MHKFSFYKNGIKNLIPSKEITLKRAVELIQSETYKEDVLRLRNTTNQNTANVIKRGLDYFTFSGTFKKRHTDDFIKHSGLICLDLDPYRKNKSEEPELINPRLLNEFDTVRQELVADKFTTVCFTSPSGTGFKLILKIDPEKHLVSFRELEKYYKSNFILTLDKGVNDIPRACFVSYDPDIFYNPDAELFVIADLPETALEIEKKEVYEAKSLTASEQFTHHKNLNRVAYVVEQAERNQIDLTGDYSDWQLLAFSLATFGEEGRPYWHRVSKMYAGYDEREADAKFNDALQKGRFKTPAKFFSIAKDYGLAVAIPKTIAEKKEEYDYKEIIGNEEDTDDYLKYGIWEAGGTYWSLDLKNRKQQVSNFSMRILYHVETSDEEAYRLIEIKNIHGHKAVVKMNTDDFVSVGSFKKVVARKGNFIFKGSEPDLCRLQDKLQREERPTKLVKQLGWNRRGKFYAFANGIYDITLNQFLPIDEYGIVEHRIADAEGSYTPQNYFIPALSKIFAEKEDLFSNDKKFVLKKSDTTFSAWAVQYCKVYGKHGELALVFYLMSIYSDIVFRDMGKRLPLLNIYGKRGTGKGTLIASLLRLFGDGQDQLMLGGASTVVGFMRKFAQYCNAIVWLDEYKNNLKQHYIESLKNIYDRVGYERGKKDNTFQTESTPILSACILSGQEMPTIEPALFIRNILVMLTETKWSEDAKDQYRKLMDMEDAGLSGITVYLMKHRAVIDEKFKATYIQEQRALVKDINNTEVDERIIINYAALMAVAELFDGLEAMPFNRMQFKELCRKTLLEQFYILKGSDDASKFWDIVETIFSEGKIKENEQFLLRNGYLYLRVQDIYQHYAETLQKRKDPNMLDKATLEKYLESDTKSFIARERRFFGGAQKWCFVFKYAELGVDRIKADTPELLKAKYREMQIDYADEAERGKNPTELNLQATAEDDDLPF